MWRIYTRVISLPFTLRFITSLINNNWWYTRIIYSSNYMCLCLTIGFVYKYESFGLWTKVNMVLVCLAQHKDVFGLCEGNVIIKMVNLIKSCTNEHSVSQIKLWLIFTSKKFQFSVYSRKETAMVRFKLQWDPYGWLLDGWAT